MRRMVYWSVYGLMVKRWIILFAMMLPARESPGFVVSVNLAWGQAAGAYVQEGSIVQLVAFSGPASPPDADGAFPVSGLAGGVPA